MIIKRRVIHRSLGYIRWEHLDFNSVKVYLLGFVSLKKLMAFARSHFLWIQIFPQIQHIWFELALMRRFIHQTAGFKLCGTCSWNFEHIKWKMLVSCRDVFLHIPVNSDNFFGYHDVDCLMFEIRCHGPVSMLNNPSLA